MKYFVVALCLSLSAYGSPIEKINDPTPHLAAFAKAVHNANATQRPVGRRTVWWVDENGDIDTEAIDNGLRMAVQVIQWFRKMANAKKPQVTTTEAPITISMYVEPMGYDDASMEWD